VGKIKDTKWKTTCISYELFSLYIGLYRRCGTKLGIIPLLVDILNFKMLICILSDFNVFNTNRKI